MSRKNKKNKKKSSLSPDQVRVQICKFLDSRKFRDAQKLAKSHHASCNTDQSRELLVETLALRAEHLINSDLQVEAKNLLQEVLALDVSDLPKWSQHVSALLLRVGMVQEVADLAGDDVDPLANEATRLRIIDQAVANPQTLPEALADLKDEVQAVHSAMDAVERGDDEQAVEMLKCVGRKSPLAEWKLFIRGLIAHYACDAEKVKANWDRLDASRGPSKIVELLRLALTPASVEDKDPATAKVIKDVRDAQLGQDLISDLRGVGEAMEDDDWTCMVRGLRSARPGILALGGDFALRLTRIIYPMLGEFARDLIGRDESVNRVSDVTRVLVPLPADPKWVLFRARCECEGGSPFIDRVCDLFDRYINGIDGLKCFSEEEKRIALAIVCSNAVDYIAAAAFEGADLRGQIEKACDYDMDQDDLDQSVQEELGYRERARAYYDRGVAAYPKMADLHRSLAAAYEAWEDEAKALECYERLLALSPNDVEALEHMVDRFWPDLYSPELDKALPYLVRLRELKPLDADYREKEMVVRLGICRQRASGGRWDDGRQAFEELEKGIPAEMLGLRDVLARAMFEIVAGNTMGGQALVDQLVDRYKSELVVYWGMILEGVYYRDMPQHKAHWWSKCSSLLQNKVTIVEAELLARLTLNYVRWSSVESIKDEVSDLLLYLSGCTRLRSVTEDQMAMICHLYVVLIESFGMRAELPEGAMKTCRKLAEKGVDKFPSRAVFRYCLAVLAMHDSKIQSHLSSYELSNAKEELREAERLADTGNKPDDLFVRSVAPHVGTLLNRLASSSLPRYFRDDDTEPNGDVGPGGDGQGMFDTVVVMMAEFLLSEIERGQLRLDELEARVDRLSAVTPGGVSESFRREIVDRVKLAVGAEI